MQDYSLSEDLKKIIGPILEENGVELVELVFIKKIQRPILKLLVDKKQGRINVGECARLNRQIGELLDTQDIIRDRYILEVSSPGLDRPLMAGNDFLRCLNQRAVFFLIEPVNGKIEVNGIIQQVTGEAVYVGIEENTIEIPLAKIRKGKLIIGLT